MQTIQPKILDFLGAKLNGKKILKIWVYPVRMPCFGNFGKCCSIHSWKLPKIQTGHFGSLVTLTGDIKQALQVIEPRKPRAIKQK